MFFGGGGMHRGRRGPQKGKDVCHQMKVSLEDLYNGAVRKLALQKNVICPKCDGEGGKKGAVQSCSNCKGTGMQVTLKIYLFVVSLKPVFFQRFAFIN